MEIFTSTETIVCLRLYILKMISNTRENEIRMNTFFPETLRRVCGKIAY